MYSYIARQPILDINKNVIAYELLFRDGKSNSFPNIDPNLATSNILTNNHLTLGVEQVTGDLPAYINFHAITLIRRFPNFLDPKKVVIEILEDLEISNKLVEAVKQLKEKGYTLALDDFDFDPKWDVLLPYIDIIKVDVLVFSLLEISKFIRRLPDTNVTLLAEKVETLEQYEKLKMLGFTLFQGYFFAKPEMLKQRKITTTKQNILDLIGQASKAELDNEVIGDIFSLDPGLTYKLLRFINSPTYGNNQEITSLRHALIYIGELELKKFITLLALSDLNAGKCDEIMRLSLIRAKFCELISQTKLDEENPPKAFLTGILSLIDGVLDHDLEYVLNALPIHPEIKSALRNEDNYLNDYLTLAKLIEKGCWQECEALTNKIDLTTDYCFETYQESLAWADGMLSDQ
ncbi:EAL and HDOD domain-containing protein [Thalassotalea castellviae]|uniref:EAL domain-containing protein n=1 Tax=Thalassotalea castellviae TaxID=3075612 RepID=A0ABU3A379_9GAMM|nr:HDOD domain-containing protein [Thalassotalea sp. W431]MDT0604395.1 EAL domain-containing protein [Thalassotalea sp. W431]